MRSGELLIFATDQVLVYVSAQDHLKEMTQQGNIAESAMAILREGGMVHELPRPNPLQDQQ